jgi:hypothetical protein
MSLRLQLKTQGKTIEFRQHERSSNPGGIKNWVRFVVALVEVARNTPEKDMADLLRILIDLPGEFGIMNFMRSPLMRIPKVAIYYEDALRMGSLFNNPEIFFLTRIITKPRLRLGTD